MFKKAKKIQIKVIQSSKLIKKWLNLFKLLLYLLKLLLNLSRRFPKILSRLIRKTPDQLNIEKATTPTFFTQVHPEYGIRTKSTSIMNRLANDVFDQINVYNLLFEHVDSLNNIFRFSSEDKFFHN